MTRKILLPHLAAAIVASGLALLIYISVQQVYRMGANDPQMQAAKDAAYRVSQNKPLGNFLTTADTIDLEQCPGMFIQLYDGNGSLLQSTGYIGRAQPAIPAGVLANAKTDGEQAVTWQPTRTVRLAAAAVYTGDAHPGYVVTARSLWDVEKRESNLLTMSLLCWVACMGVIIAHGLLQGFLLKKKA